MNKSLDNAAGPKRRRRWFQFSLRTLLGVTTIFAIWLGWQVQQARNQAAAVAALRAKNVEVIHDFDGYREGEEPVPDWFRRLVGIDFYSKVEYVTADHGDVGGQTDTMTDADMVHFADLPDIQDIRLTAQQEVSDAGIAHLSGLKQLETLDLLGVNISDYGMVHLRALRNLETLTLAETEIGDAGLANLSHLTSLRNLSLSYTNISDAGLVHLKGLSRLEQFDLYNTDVTDAGLEQLKGLKSLKTLDLASPHVSAAGVREIQQALPNCTIGYRPRR